jgi:hypothetical protein
MDSLSLYEISCFAAGFAGNDLHLSHTPSSKYPMVSTETVANLLRIWPSIVNHFRQPFRLRSVPVTCVSNHIPAVSFFVLLV